MALEGLKKMTSKMLVKSTSAGPWYNLSDEQKGKFRDGVGLCNHYDTELDSLGFCRDEECRRNRVMKALHSGEAMMTPDGVLVWCPGVKIRKM
jgi:hypothetical protein